MEHVTGETLRAMLERKRLTRDEARSILTPIFDALGHAHHAGVLHRDIKPSAIVVTPQGEPKLLDFGLAIDADSGVDNLTQVGTVLGTPAYMSPEQLKGEPLDARSDLYSLGLVIYESLTGERPFAGSVTTLMHKMLHAEPPAPSTLLACATPALDRFMARMLAKSPDARYRDAAEAKAAFLEALDALATTPAC
jgi:serine/threonine-protein kinase